MAVLLAGFSWRRLLFPGVRFGSPAPLNSTTLSLCRFPGLVDDKEKTNGSMMSCAEVGVDEDGSNSPTRSRTRLPMFLLVSMPVLSLLVLLFYFSQVLILQPEVGVQREQTALSMVDKEA